MTALLAGMDCAPDRVAARDAAMRWLLEHLAFTVPLHMADIDHRARQPIRHPGPLSPRTYAKRVDRIGRDATGLSAKGERTITAMLATQGDTLLGESAPGRGAALATGLAVALAAAALTHEDGATFHHLHWCVQRPCAHREETP